MRRAVLFVAVVGLVLALPTSAHAERTLGLSAESFSLELEPGDGERQSITVYCSGDEPISVKVLAVDQTVDASGVVDYAVPGGSVDRGRTLASWLTLYMPDGTKYLGNTPYLDMRPGDEAEVSFEVAAPDDAPSGDHHAAIMFEGSGPSSSTQAGAEITMRVAVPVRLRVAGASREEVEIKPFVVPVYVIGNRVPFSFTIVNRGNVDEVVRTRLELLDRDEATLGGSVDETSTTVFAATSSAKTGVLTADSITPGLYTVALRAEMVARGGSLTPITKTRTIVVIPEWAAYGGSGLVVVGLLGITWLSGARFARRQRSDPAINKD